MRDLFEALKTVLAYFIYGLLWLALFGVIFLFAAAVVGDPIMSHPITIGIGIFTTVMLGGLCIFLWVDSNIRGR